MKRLLFVIFASTVLCNSSAIDNARMMRYPDINGNLIAFVYARDIWTVNSDLC